jgi:hypothetical protein
MIVFHTLEIGVKFVLDDRRGYLAFRFQGLAKTLVRSFVLNAFGSAFNTVISIAATRGLFRPRASV